MATHPKRTIAVDFDGVIHVYRTPWTTAQEIADEPMPGAFEWLRKVLNHGFHVVIYSARLPVAEWELTEWFRDHAGIDLLEHERFGFALEGKPPALVYLDDRGLRFSGSWPSLAELDAHPWRFGIDTEADTVKLLRSVDAFQEGPKGGAVPGVSLEALWAREQQTGDRLAIEPSDREWFEKGARSMLMAMMGAK